jgi:hypothetical protein
VLVAGLLPLFGAAVDRFGLLAVWAISSGILLLGLLIKLVPQLPRASACLGTSPEPHFAGNESEAPESLTTSG